MRKFIWLIATTLLIPSILCASDDEPSLNTKSFTRSPFIGSILTTHDAGMTKPLDYNFGLSLIYSRDPLVSEYRGTKTVVREIVEHKMEADLTFAMGITSFLDFGINVPLNIYQDGEGYFNSDMKNVGIGDISVFPRVKIVSLDKGLLDVAFIGEVTIPTGQLVDKLMGYSSFTAAPTIAVSSTYGRFKGAVNLSYRIAKEEKIADLQSDDELGVKLALSYSAVPELLDFMAELNTKTLVDDPFGSSAKTPMDTNFGARYHIKKLGISTDAGVGFGLTEGANVPAYRVFAGISYRPPAEEKKPAPVIIKDRDNDTILDKDDNCPDVANTDQKDLDKDGIGDKCDEDMDGDKIANKKDLCPMEKEDYDKFEDDDGCPENDNDEDGILNENDKCPLVAEDEDNFEDEDGCPDPDNDKDGIDDAKDKCPMEPETMNKFMDEDGCPDTAPVLKKIEVKAEKIEIKEKIFFAVGKARILKRSFELLDEVASVLVSNKEIKLSIEGHTDSTGSRAYNLRLSQQRAESVRTYLIKKGVEEDRLTAKGFGPDQPIADNKTREGRSENRRVEFRIVTGEE